MARLSLKKKVKKEWFPIIAPKVFNNVEIGETIAADINKTIGRTVELPLNFVLNDPSKNFVWAKFRIVRADENEKKVYTEVEEIFLSRQYIYRIVRPGTKKVEIIFDCFTKDNKKVRVKAIIITAGKAHYNQRRAIRKAIIEHLTNLIKNMEYYELINSVVNRGIQNEMLKVAKKIYPIHYAEIRRLQLMKK